jgi:hypothetical protein
VSQKSDLGFTALHYAAQGGAVCPLQLQRVCLQALRRSHALRRPHPNSSACRSPSLRRTLSDDGFAHGCGELGGGERLRPTNAVVAGGHADVVEFLCISRADINALNMSEHSCMCTARSFVMVVMGAARTLVCASQMERRRCTSPRGGTRLMQCPCFSASSPTSLSRSAVGGRSAGFRLPARVCCARFARVALAAPSRPEHLLQNGEGKTAHDLARSEEVRQLVPGANRCARVARALAVPTRHQQTSSRGPPL